jgi:peptidyl-prolyl cis-trans isomerase C
VTDARRGVSRAARAALLAAALAAAACGGPEPTSERAHLGGAVAARVGDHEIAVSSVVAVARAQGIAPAAARDLLVRDAVFAEAARARGLTADFQVDGALARRLLHAYAAEGAAAGDVTDAELDAETQRHWLEIDRPEGFRTVHAVVLVKPDASADTKQRAAAVAEAIRARATALDLGPAPPPSRFSGAGAVAHDPAEKAFIDAAQAVPHDGFKVTAEALPPLTRDARWLSPDASSGVDPAFAAAAASLGSRGDVSPLTWTGFGVHVIVLLERTPAKHPPAAERRALVREAVMRARAEQKQKALLTARAADATVERSADASLALVPVAP